MKLHEKLNGLPKDSRVSKSKWSQIRKLKLSPWLLHDSESSQLRQKLSDAGYRVDLAAGEADVHIANAVCSKLKISNDQWVSLAIVSGNDYSDNVYGFGFGKNLNIIRSIDFGYNVKQIVVQYAKIMDAGSQFDVALQVFDDCYESFNSQSLNEEGRTHQQSCTLNCVVQQICSAEVIEWSMIENLEEIAASADLSFDERNCLMLNALKSLYGRWIKQVEQLKDDKTRLYQEWKKSRHQVSHDRESVQYLQLPKKYQGYNRFCPLFEKNALAEAGNICRKGRYLYKAVDVNRPSKSEIPPIKVTRTIEQESDQQNDAHGSAEDLQQPVANKTHRNKRRRESSKPDKVQRGNYRQSSAKTRDKVTAMPSGKKRTNSQETQLFRSLNRRHAICTKEIGHIQKSLSKGQASAALQILLKYSIDTVVKEMNLLKRMAQLGARWFIDTILKNFPDQIQLLDSICYADTPGQGGRKFWQGILRFLRNGKSTRSQKCAAVLKFGQLIKGQSTILDKLQGQFDRRITVSQIIDQLAIVLDSEFASQVIGRMELLAAKVLEFDESKRDQITEIDMLDSIFQKYDALNSLLPEEERFAYPLSLLSECYVTFTGNSLMQLIQSVITNCWDVAEQQLIQNGLSNVSAQSLRREQNEWYQNGKLMKQKGETLAGIHGLKMNGGLRLLRDYDPISTNSKSLGCTFLTNGLVLKVHCINTKQSKPVERVQSGSRSLLQGAEATRVKIQRKFSSRIRVPAIELSDYWICCIDIGERYTVGAVAEKGAGESRQLRSLTIKSAALNEPNRRFRRWFGERSHTIQDAERSLERLQVESLLDYWVRYIATYSQLREFYCHSRWKRASWDQKKAQRAEYDRATNAILKMVDGKINQKCYGKVIFGLGDAQFESKQTTHQSFEKYFVAKVKSRGYPVIYLNEYLTSQKAPCCGRMCESFGLRVKYCRQCHKFFHRDIMAAENLVNVAKAVLAGLERPPYLCSKASGNIQREEGSMRLGKRAIQLQTISRRLSSCKSL
ncbi:hypothetical protein MIR68_011407 [Amoeboaphelidium protococcarum]|nr:hypothetical protein MIR68_011407 [Amoeboaphelidium protococcarum]